MHSRTGTNKRQFAIIHKRQTTDAALEVLLAEHLLRRSFVKSSELFRHSHSGKWCQCCTALEHCEYLVQVAAHLHPPCAMCVAVILREYSTLSSLLAARVNAVAGSVCPCGAHKIKGIVLLMTTY